MSCISLHVKIVRGGCESSLQEKYFIHSVEGLYQYNKKLNCFEVNDFQSMKTTFIFDAHALGYHFEHEKMKSADDKSERK